MPRFQHIAHSKRSRNGGYRLRGEKRRILFRKLVPRAEKRKSFQGLGKQIRIRGFLRFAMLLTSMRTRARRAGRAGRGGVRRRRRGVRRRTRRSGRRRRRMRRRRGRTRFRRRRATMSLVAGTTARKSDKPLRVEEKIMRKDVIRDLRRRSTRDGWQVSRHQLSSLHVDLGFGEPNRRGDDDLPECFFDLLSLRRRKDGLRSRKSGRRRRRGRGRGGRGRRGRGGGSRRSRDRRSRSRTRSNTSRRSNS